MTSSTSYMSTCYESYLQNDGSKDGPGNLKRKREHSSLDNTCEPEDLDEDSCCMLEYVPKIAEFFRIVEKIGEGTFSSVYLAKLKSQPDVDQMFALKHIIPTSHPSRIENELKCLQLIGGVDNVIGVSCCIREKDHVVIVMPYFKHDKFQSYLQSMTISEICSYMKHLLISLRRVHQFDIIHRDVKPSNFLYNRKRKSYALVDFGLAHKATVLLKEKKEEDSDKASLSPGKRKTRRSVENKTPASPEKSQQTDTKSSLSERSQNIFDSGKMTMKTNEKASEAKKSRIPDKPVAVFKAFKSPRRTLLNTRAIMASTGLTLTRNDSVKRSMDGTLAHRRTLSKPFGFRGGQSTVTCHCFGTPSVCTMCVSRANQSAPRAGTPGYRSPEVLMKCPSQSTSVDIWSAGVIFLSLLTQRYPFFRANNDMTALAQIISVMGSGDVQKAALTYNKSMICSPNRPTAHLKNMCIALRRCTKSPKHRAKRSCPEKPDEHDPLCDVPDTAYDLLKRLLDVDPNTRITAEDALNHPYFTS
ncbi:cell division cycle 7-related protein kinase-like [Lineus longissimus]|uniref:cell division cycle 7-related protein kinase-like n=1 Tax=Lineus longissimus TaxID=88925 RepID=UPI002B4D224B